MAYADPPDVDELSDLVPRYIGLSAEDVSDYCVARVWKEGVVTEIGTIGELEWTLNVYENSAEDIDTCWVYFDGEVYTGTSVDLCTESYRNHYGAVIIKFEDESFDYASFEVIAGWPGAGDEYVESLNNQPPANPNLALTLPTEVYSVFTDISGIDPEGPSEAEWNGWCDANGQCSPVESSGKLCMSYVECPQP